MHEKNKINVKLSDFINYCKEKFNIKNFFSEETLLKYSNNIKQGIINNNYPCFIIRYNDISSNTIYKMDNGLYYMSSTINHKYIEKSIVELNKDESIILILLMDFINKVYLDLKAEIMNICESKITIIIFDNSISFRFLNSRKNGEHRYFKFIEKENNDECY